MMTHILSLKCTVSILFVSLSAVNQLWWFHGGLCSTESYQGSWKSLQSPCKIYFLLFLLPSTIAQSVHTHGVLGLLWRNTMTFYSEGSAVFKLIISAWGIISFYNSGPMPFKPSCLDDKGNGMWRCHLKKWQLTSLIMTVYELTFL